MALNLIPGAVYLVHHSSGSIRWKYDRTVTTAPWHGEYRTIRGVKRHHGINLKTGREIILKSMAKIVRQVE